MLVNNLFVDTFYDDKDYISVREIYYLDEQGGRIIHKQATSECFSLVTCADQDTKGLESLKLLVEDNLKAANITYSSIVMDDPY